MHTLISTFSICFFLLVTSCGGGGGPLETTDLVETGVYDVTVNEVDMQGKAIYVETPEGKVLGLRFTDQTQLTQSEQSVDFDALRPGQTLRIRLERKNSHLEPLEVKIVG